MRKQVKPLVIGDPSNGGFRGLNLCGSNNDIAFGQSPNAYNYLISNTGLEKRTGCAKYNAQEIGSNVGATGLFRYCDSVNFHTLMKIGASVYDVLPNAQVLTGLDTSTIIDFCGWFNTCFIADGEKMYKSTGGAFSEVAFKDEEGGTLTTYPHPKSIILHNERLYMLDTLNPTYVFYTVTDYHERFISDGSGRAISSVVCDRDDGEALVGLVRTGDRIMAFKRHKSYFIIGDYTDSNLSVFPGPPVGAYNQNCIIQCPDGFTRWVGPDGVWEYRDDVGPVCISRNKNWELDIEEELKQVSDANADKCVLGYYDHYLLFFYPRGISSVNDYGLVYDTVIHEWMMIRGWKVSCMYRFEDDYLYAGWADQGFCKRLFAGNNDDGQPIEAYYETKQFGVEGTQQLLDSIRGQIAKGRSLHFSWKSDPESNSSGSIVFDYAASSGVLLGNRDKPAASGTVRLGDRDNLGSGTTLSNRGSILTAVFSKRFPIGQKFREVSFIIQEDSSSAHQIDYVEIRAIPLRSVI